MSSTKKQVESLTVADFQAFPVWKFSLDESQDDTLVSPLKKTPVKNLDGKIVGCMVKLANGKSVWGILGNIDAAEPRLTQEFLTLSVENDGKWFHLKRYFDPGYGKSEPKGLAKFLGLDVDDVFPIVYDVTRHVAGNRDALKGEIPKKPKKKLSEDERIALAVP